MAHWQSHFFSILVGVLSLIPSPSFSANPLTPANIHFSFQVLPSVRCAIGEQSSGQKTAGFKKAKKVVIRLPHGS